MRTLGARWNPICPAAFRGDTLDESIANASEAITLWNETVLNDWGDIQKPGSVSAYQENPEFTGCDLGSGRGGSLLEDQTERMNITPPCRVLARLDIKPQTPGGCPGAGADPRHRCRTQRDLRQPPDGPGIAGLWLLGRGKERVSD